MMDSDDSIRQFGKQKDGVVYRPRPSVYAIVYDPAGDLLLARARGKLVLPGGGIDDGETPEQALHREVLEETGWRIKILGQACRANEYVISKRKNRATNKLAQFFLAVPLDQAHAPLDDDHEPLWVSRPEAIKDLRREFFRWAVEQTVAP